MGRKTSAFAAVLLAAACAYFLTRAPEIGSPTRPADEPTADVVEPAEPGALRDPGGLGESARSGVASTATEAGRRIPVAEEPTDPAPTARRANLLRVTLEGISEADARLAQVTLTGVGEDHRWPAEVRDAWPGQGLTSEFDLGPFLTAVERRGESLTLRELKIRVDHPLRFSETTTIPWTPVDERWGDPEAEPEKDPAIHEARVRFDDVVYWPEFSLVVRDAVTREHLDGVELRCIVTAFMGTTRRPGTDYPYTVIGDGLSSPIPLSGGRKATGPDDWAAGIAVRAAASEMVRPIEFAQPEENARGVIVFAAAPGYAWGRIVVDVSKVGERELLLVPSAELDLRLTNVQLEGYAALDKQASLIVTRTNADGEADSVWGQRLDGSIEAEGLRLEGLEPGEFAVSVELGTPFTMRQRPVLAREELLLAAGETRALVLDLPDPPAPPERVVLGGTVSFPAFGGERDVRLQLYLADYMYGGPDHELSLADMEAVGGALPTWAFRLRDMPVGSYQVRLLPFEANWMIELPAGGAEDVELVIPELAEVFVETVDAKTGEPIPLEVIRYGSTKELPGRVHHEWSSSRTTTDFEGQPGRFRFWTAPGAAYVQTYSIPSGVDVGMHRQALELVPGLQSVRFELAPPCAIHFEFRVDGAALPREDEIFVGLGRTIRAVDHDGTAAPVSYEVVGVSGPGVYALSFEGVGADRFLPIQPRHIDVQAGETAKVVVELRRK